MPPRLVREIAEKEAHFTHANEGQLPLEVELKSISNLIKIGKRLGKNLILESNLKAKLILAIICLE